jgi:hypothetical protein
MTAIVWTAFGMAFGAAVLYGTLALRKPRDRTYLSFACAMAAVTAFLYYECQLYNTSTLSEAIAVLRRREVMAHAVIAALLVFIPAYTRTRLRWPVAAAYWGALGILCIANVTSLYGIWFSAEPQLARPSFFGAHYTTLVAPPFSLLQHAYTLYLLSLFVLAVALAVPQIRRGERQRGVALLISAVLLVAPVGVDTVREVVGGTWPFVAELGFASWGLIMSVQLALDFRAQTFRIAHAISIANAQAARSTAILAAMDALDRNIHAPLRTLEAGLESLDASTRDDDLDRMRRAIMRLRELAAER